MVKPLQQRVLEHAGEAERPEEVVEDVLLLGSPSLLLSLSLLSGLQLGASLSLPLPLLFSLLLRGPIPPPKQRTVVTEERLHEASVA